MAAVDLNCLGCAAIWFFQLASFSPLFTVELVDFTYEQETLNVWTEKDQYLAQLPLDQYIQVVTNSPDFYFRPSDIPLNKITGGLQPNFREGYLALTQDG